MGSEAHRRQARETRETRIRRRKRQIRSRMLVLGAGVLVLVLLAVVTVRGKRSIEVLGTEAAAAETQEEAASEEPGTEAVAEPEQDTESGAAAEENGWTVVIDAGHGGKDQGCAYGDVIEKDINLAIALLLEQKLSAAGCNVVMTRDDDTFIYLNRRVEAAENAGADIYISIHVDSYSDDESINGLTIHFQEGADGGKEMAETIHASLQGADLMKIRDVMESDLYVLRNTTMPAVLIEFGFLTNRTDRANLQSDTFLEALSDGVYEGIIEYLDKNEKN